VGLDNLPREGDESSGKEKEREKERERVRAERGERVSGGIV